MNDDRAYYVQASSGTYLAVFASLTTEVTKRHLDGIITLALPAISPAGTSRWICFDDDNQLPEGQAGYLDQIETILAGDDYFYVREGKRPLADGLAKQGHLWVLLDQPIETALARGWGLSIMGKAGLKESTANFELYPKRQSFQKVSTGVRVPLGRHAKAGGKRLWLPGLPEDLEQQLEHLVGLPLNDSARIIDMGRRKNELIEARERYRSNFIKPRYKPGKGPSVLEMLTELDYDLVDIGKSYKTRCPVCADEGHDNAGDNLAVAKDHTWYGCWYGGWNQKHTYSQIYRTLRDRTC